MQTLLSVLGGGALNIWEVGWHSAFGVAAGSALLAFLMAADRWGALATESASESHSGAITGDPEPPVELVALVNPKTVGCGESLR